MSEAPAGCLQAALQDLDTGFQNFFEHGFGYPTPRRKFDNDSFRFPAPLQIKVDSKTGLLILPKFGKTSKDAGPIKARFHRRIRGVVRSVTIIRDGLHWYASILYRVKKPKVDPDAPELTAENVLGVDRGVVVPMMTSNGDALGFGVAPPAKSGRARRGRCLQKKLARQQKGSKRREATRKRIAAFKGREKRQRKDMIEKASTKVARSCQVAVIEDLRVQSMTASAKGTVKTPGRNVAAKAGLNCSILDKGWGMFASRLDQKMAAKGGQVIRVPAA